MVLRFTNNEVETELEAVLRRIEAAALLGRPASPPGPLSTDFVERGPGGEAG
jgi:hypothetical protein